MGIFSWLRFRRPADRLDRPERTHSLVRSEYDDPKLEPLRRAVAEDLARLEETDKRRGEDLARLEEGDKHRGEDTTPGER